MRTRHVYIGGFRQTNSLCKGAQYRDGRQIDWQAQLGRHIDRSSLKL
jgi:hypothetical protein